MSWELFHPEQDKVLGPFDEDNVVDQIRRGLNPRTLARREGEEEWKGLRTHAPFAFALQRYQGDDAPLIYPPSEPTVAVPKKPRQKISWKRILIMLALPIVGLIALSRDGDGATYFLGGLVLLAIGIVLSRSFRLRRTLAVGGVMGGAGVDFLRILYFIPALCVIGGILMMVKAFIPSLGTPEALSHCGDPGHMPKSKKLLGDWNQYRCMARNAAGSRWASCVSRAEYSDQQGRGCEGDDMCCPPSIASAGPR
jgi:hypothetical protein